MSLRCLWGLLAAICFVATAQQVYDDETDHDKRSPLDTMRFGKRSYIAKYAMDEPFTLVQTPSFQGLVRKERALGTMRFGKRSGLRSFDNGNFFKRSSAGGGDPLSTMRFGKRTTNPLNTMRFGKRDPLSTMRFGRK
ncbi:unnamed protein product, partial [Mesorhabditis spiculigera]